MTNESKFDKTIHSFNKLQEILEEKNDDTVDKD